MKYLILVLLLMCFYSIGAFSQEAAVIQSRKENSLKKNSIFGHIGIIPPIWAMAASVSYDRSVFVAKDRTDVRAKLSVGYIGILMGNSNNYQSLTLGILTGEYNHHFELYGGATLTQSNDPKGPGMDFTKETSRFGVFPAGNIGYRFQKPDG